jgi:glutamyl-tRNA synthetase
MAFSRAREANGYLIFRDEDLDPLRCKREFADAAMHDLRRLGLYWDAGPDIAGPEAPYRQSERMSIFLDAWNRLHSGSFIYPCTASRKDVAEALHAPHGNDGEAIFPTSLRPILAAGRQASSPGAVNWRFRVPDGRRVFFDDLRCGPQVFVAGQDFGDFLIWRKDGYPSYELAVVADDAAMGITEVVRGQDLLLSTARQLLLYEALAYTPPSFYHCPLITDQDGRRLAKRDGATTLRTLWASGQFDSAWSACLASIPF